MQALAGLAATDFAAAGSPEGKAWMAALPSLASVHRIGPNPASSMRS
jgi:hypothetical protein